MPRACGWPSSRHAASRNRDRGVSGPVIGSRHDVFTWVHIPFQHILKPARSAHAPSARPGGRVASSALRGASHAHSHDIGRHANLLQGLGPRAARSVQPWVAAQRRCLGRPDGISGIEGLPRHRARSPRPRSIEPALERQRDGHLRRRSGRARRGARPARTRFMSAIPPAAARSRATSAATGPRASPRPC